MIIKMRFQIKYYIFKNLFIYCLNEDIQYINSNSSFYQSIKKKNEEIHQSRIYYYLYDNKNINNYL